MTKQQTQLLSDYLDGTLHPEQRASAERLLEQSDEARKIFSEFQQIKITLQHAPKLEPSPFFWSRLSHRIEQGSAGSASDSFLPVPKKFLPALLVIGTIVIVLGASLLFRDSGKLNRYVSEQAKFVKSFYDATMNTTLFPYLSDVNNDDVLTFAVNGYVPVKNSQEVLEIGNSEQKKYWVKLKKSSEAPPIKVEDFCTAVAARPDQKEKIHAVLKKYQPEIEQSILLTNHDTLAIASDVWEMNNAILFEIANQLDHAQRVELERWASARNAHVDMKFSQVDFRHANDLWQKAHVRPRPESFVIVTPDTTMLKSCDLKQQHVRVTVDNRAIPKIEMTTPAIARNVYLMKRINTGKHPSVIVHSRPAIPPPESEEFSINIEVPDVDFTFTEHPLADVRDSLWRQLRKFRIQKAPMMALEQLGRGSYEVAVRAAKEGMDQARKVLIESGEKRIEYHQHKAPQQYRYEYEIANRPDARRLKEMNVRVIVDSAINVRMRDLEHQMQFNARRYDSLAWMFEKKLKREWNASVRSMNINDSIITIDTPDSQTIFIRRKDVRR